MLPCRRDLGEVPERQAEARGVERMQLHERLRMVARQPRRLPVRVIVPLVANAARVEHERIVAARLRGCARGGVGTSCACGSA